MTSPLVEPRRTVPLINQKGNSRINIPMEFEETTGFPFEREPERDGHFRSQLDDLAKRHPELAEHLGTFSRRRQSSGDEPDGFHRRFERPFGGATDRFERFGFPFDRDDFDPEQYAQQFYQQQPEQQQPKPQQSHQQQYSYQPQPQEYQQPQQSPPQQNPEEPSASETGRNNIQQSNTTDLGQKQEPVNDRNQRSMSAPPTEKGQRFTSSIKIPVNQPQPEETENMAQTQSQQQTDGKTTERIIPIHIEGRDEPVLPKTAPPTYSQPHQTYSAGPQPERIFGQRPEHFTQFVNREPQFDKWHRPGFEQMHQGYVPEEFARQQKFPQQNVPPFYQQQQQRPAPQPHPQPKEDIPIPVQRDEPQAKQQAPPQQTVPPQQPKPAAQPQRPKNPIEQIQVIQKDVSELMGHVEQFLGQPKDKQYLYLDEMLTRNLLKLDNIDTQGQEAIRSARKEAIKCIEKAISVLEAKAAGNVAPPKAEENMEVEEKPQEPAEQTEVQTMETDPTPDSKAEDSQPQPMEASPESKTEIEPAAAEEEKPVAADPQPVTENRAVLVTTENKEAEEKVESKEEPPVVAAEEAKPEATSEGQESNLPVAEAVKKFEGKEDGQEEKKPEEGAELQQEEKSEEKKEQKKAEEAKTEEKKEKRKGKKKAEKKEK